MFDYSGFEQLASRMMERFGRTVALKYETTEIGPSGKPWDIVPTPHTLEVQAVAQPFRADQIDRSVIMAHDRKYIVAAKDVNSVPTPDWWVVDSGITYSVLSVEKTAPGDTDIIYTLHCRA